MLLMGYSSPVRHRCASRTIEPLLFLWAVFAIGVLLTGCTSTEERQARALNVWAKITGTGSGAVHVAKETVQETIKTGKKVVEDVGAVAEDVGQRIDQVKSGIDKIQEGKKLIESGLNGTGGTK